MNVGLQVKHHCLYKLCIRIVHQWWWDAAVWSNIVTWRRVVSVDLPHVSLTLDTPMSVCLSPILWVSKRPSPTVVLTKLRTHCNPACTWEMFFRSLLPIGQNITIGPYSDFVFKVSYKQRNNIIRVRLLNTKRRFLCLSRPYTTQFRPYFWMYQRPRLYSRQPLIKRRKHVHKWRIHYWSSHGSE